MLVSWINSGASRVADLTIGTAIVLVHLAMADRLQRGAQLARELDASDPPRAQARRPRAPSQA